MKQSTDEKEEIQKEMEVTAVDEETNKLEK